MLTIEKKFDGPDTVILSLAGELTIETVAELRESLLEVFAGTSAQMRVDGAALSHVDMFGLQLLCSAHRTAVAKKKLLTWHHGRPAQISDAMQLSGFNRHCGCSLCPADVDCMWI